MELAIRYMTVGALALVASLMLLSSRKTATIYFGIGLCLSLICLSISSSPHFPEPTNSTRIFLRIGDAPNLLFFWLFARSLYDDHFKMRAFEYAVSVSYIAILVIERLMEGDWIDDAPLVSIIAVVFGLLLIMHLIFSISRGWKSDLINARRTSRLFLASILCFAALIGTLITNAIWTIERFSFGLSDSLVIGAATFSIAIYILQFVPERIGLDAYEDKSTSNVPAKDLFAYEALMNLINSDEEIRNPDLTIGSLAKKIGISEYKLRRIINTHLGYKNFNDFINHYRLNFAKQLLSNSDNSHLPILTIAMDSGYNSISAFNRAFKRHEGETPSQYRSRNY